MAAKFKPAYVFIYLQLHMLKKKKKGNVQIFFFCLSIVWKLNMMKFLPVKHGQKYENHRE